MHPDYQNSTPVGSSDHDLLLEFLHSYAARLGVVFAVLAYPNPPARPDPVVAGLYSIRSSTLAGVDARDVPLLLRQVAHALLLCATCAHEACGDAAHVARRILFAIDSVRVPARDGTRPPAGVPIVDAVVDPVLRDHHGTLRQLCLQCISSSQPDLPGVP